ncbi:MAG: RHS repeat domain-containing protein [Cyanobacteria bacterium P01_H01_bin.15]
MQLTTAVGSSLAFTAYQDRRDNTGVSIYDSRGQLTSVTDGEQAVITYAYDPEDNLMLMRDRL